MEPVVFTVLGSGTLVPDRWRACAAHHVRAGRTSVLLDCGSGALHALDAWAIDWSHLTHVALTHFHYDHLADLPAVLIALKHGLTRGAREEPLTLVGPRGLRRLLQRWADAVGTAFLEQAFPVHIVELEPGGRVEIGGLTLSCHVTPHTDESLAYRVASPGGDLGYTGDTGPCEAIADFFKGVRLLVAECTLDDPPPHERHLTPQGLARLAERADPEVLVITHVAPPLSPAEAVSAVSRRWPGRTVEGVDGLVARVGEGPVAVDLPGRGGYT